MAKIRLDKKIADKFPTRSKAGDAIRNGNVIVEGKVQKKPGFLVEEDAVIEILNQENEFVSRAAGKLLGAFEEFDFHIENENVLDIGASTGGFTQVCLQKGARKVYALDVGHLQLAKELDEDPRVVKMEDTNARYITKDMFEDPIDFICMDTSFISAKTILDPVLKELDPKHLAVLIKPQFECGPQFLNKNGILRNEKVRERILQDYLAYFKKSYPYVRWMDSKVAGRKGNQEFVLYASKEREGKHD